MNAQRDELEDYGVDMQNSWEGGLGNYDGIKSMQFDTEGVPLLGPYIFGTFFNLKMTLCSDTICRKKQQIYGHLIFTLAPKRCQSSPERQWVFV